MEALLRHAETSHAEVKKKQSALGGVNPHEAEAALMRNKAAKVLACSSRLIACSSRLLADKPAKLETMALAAQKQVEVAQAELSSSKVAILASSCATACLLACLLLSFE